MTTALLEKHRLVSKILTSHKINREVVKIGIKAPDMGGDHFSSIVEFWTVDFEDGGASLDLFVKRSVANEKFAAILEEMQMFVKEAGFFVEFYPEMIQLLKRKGSESEAEFLETSLPKCYYADSHLIVQENLAKKGYALQDKLIPHNMEQARKVYKILACLHGTSYALIESIGGLDESLKRYPYLAKATLWTECGLTLNGSFIQGAIEGALKILESCPTPGSDTVLEFVMQYHRDGFWKLAKFYDKNQPKTCANVINHGDCWTTNFMWTKDKETGSTDKCLLVDFQTVHFGSPVLDLLYYTFFAGDSRVRQQNWRQLLQEYYDAFKHYSESGGRQLKFSFEDLLEDYRSKCEVGFFFGMLQIFGMEGIEEMKEVDKVEGDIGQYFTSTITLTVEKNMEAKGEQYSRRIVQAYEGYQSIKQARHPSTLETEP